MKLENNDLLTIYNLENEKVSHKMLKFITQLVLMFAARIIVSFILATIYFGINYSEVQISAELLNIDKNIILLELFSDFGVIAVYFIYNRLIDHYSYYTMGFDSKKIVKDYTLGAVIGFLMFCFCILSGVIFNQTEIISNLYNADYIFILLIFIGFLIQGMSEEILCRGFIMKTLSKKCGVLGGIMINSIIFGLLHIFNDNITFLAIFNLILFGIFMSLVYYLTNNLWMVGAIHSIWNFSQGSIFGIRVSGIELRESLWLSKNVTDNIYNGGTFGMEGGLFCMLVEVTDVIVCIYLINKKTKCK